VLNMSPSLEVPLGELDRDALQTCQASLLRQLHGLVGGVRVNLESAQVYLSTVMNVGVTCFSPERVVVEAERQSFGSGCTASRPVCPRSATVCL
jgi:hypothetical protein